MMLAHPLPDAAGVRHRAAFIVALIALLSAGWLLPLSGAQAATTVPLGTADSFAILSGETITNTGATTVTGDIGLHPGTAVTGFGPGADAVTQDGSLHVADGVALQAKNDLTTAYNNAAGQTPVTRIPTELGMTTLTAGAYDSAAGTFGITGPLTLDGAGDPDAVFIFKMGSTLTAASNSSVNLINGADPCNVFWQVGSSATIGTDSTMVGTVIALTSITLETRATVQGRVLARNGSVTLDTNTITTAECATPAVEDDTPVDEDAPVDEDTPVDGDAGVEDDTTGQVREVPRGSVAAGGGIGGSTALGWMSLLLVSAFMLVVAGGTVGIAARRRSRG